MHIKRWNPLPPPPPKKKKEKEKEKEKINDLFLVLLSASLWSYLADYLYVNLDKMS